MARKAWLKDVAERRGFGVAGKRGRKAWLKGAVLRHACRIGDVSRFADLVRMCDVNECADCGEHLKHGT